MEPNEQRRAVDELVQLVRDADGPVPGAALGQHIRNRYPGVLSETLSLTKLLDRFARELTIVGRQGTDLLWGLDRPDGAPALDIDDLLVVEEAITSRGRPEDVSLLYARFMNYRSLKDVTLRLADLTVLVGANGAGKSNILDALFRGVSVTQSKPDTKFDGANQYSRVVLKGADGGFTLSFEGSMGWRYAFRSESVGHGPPTFTARAGITESTQLPSLALTPFYKAFGDVLHLRLNANVLAQPTYSPEEEPFLREDGLYLPSVLASLAGADRDRLEQIKQRLQELVPQVEDLRTLRKRMRVWRPILPNQPESQHQVEVVGHELQLRIRGEWIPADQLSEGTLLALGMHTVMSRPIPPKLILIDDVDRGLHPTAQTRLVQQLQKVAGPLRRVVCTSHSPFVLDPIPTDAIRVVQLNEHGHTLIGDLAEHPEWSDWKDTMNAAEFWLYAGDEWLVQTG